MSKNEKIKKNFINEIINIIKKYNISIEEIINTYIERYQNFNEKEKIQYILQYQNFTKYKILKENYNIITKDTSQNLLFPYTIIDDYIII